ncbi:MAG: class I SAM-dependent methyltransferase [Prevotella sp.]|jgi:2-polyprenyl-3-methyl-5-hydroxy-6-metoxy-1,4-benzoquinol methylase|nr:class I SAM-dependent methyltransferase [Prevotella sp.]
MDNNTHAINLGRQTNSELPSKYSQDYIINLYLFKDLKDAFASYIKKGDYVFDIGCGNKPYEKDIRNIIKSDLTDHYVGCDVVQSSEQKVDIICEATNIPADSSTYDIVICTQVIEHVFDHAKIFEEAYRLLKPGGFFIVSSNFVWAMHEMPYDFYRFTKYAFRQLLTNAGFKVKAEKANGGKFAVLGQMILHVLWLTVENSFIRKTGALFCNWLFPKLDNKFKHDNTYTLNYVFVGEK